MTSVLITADTVALLTRTLHALQGKTDPAPVKTLPRWLPDGNPITELKDLAAVLCLDERTAAFVTISSFNPPTSLLAQAKRKVRTQEGAERYGQNIGEVIRPDGPSTGSRIMAAITAGAVAMTFIGAAAGIGHAEIDPHTHMEVTISASAFHDKESALSLLDGYITQHAEAFNDPATSIAIWHDGDADEYVVDLAKVVEADGQEQGIHRHAAETSRRDDGRGERPVAGRSLGSAGTRPKAPVARIIRHRSKPTGR